MRTQLVDGLLADLLQDHRDKMEIVQLSRVFFAGRGYFDGYFVADHFPPKGGGGRRGFCMKHRLFSSK